MNRRDLLKNILRSAVLIPFAFWKIENLESDEDLTHGRKEILSDTIIPFPLDHYAHELGIRAVTPDHVLHFTSDLYILNSPSTSGFYIERF